MIPSFSGVMMVKDVEIEEKTSEISPAIARRKKNLNKIIAKRNRHEVTILFIRYL